MTPAPMRGLESQGLPAHGMQPSGMLRIRQGQQERYIWPVHLPGWLAAGWRVAEPPALQGAEPLHVDSAVETAATALAAAEITAQESSESSEAPPVSTRGRRGRRRKEDISPAATDQAATELAAVLPQEPVQLDPLLTGNSTPDSGPDATTEPSADTTAEIPAEPAAALDDEGSEAPLLTALLDDLFDDPLT